MLFCTPRRAVCRLAVPAAVRQLLTEQPVDDAADGHRFQCLRYV